MLGFHVVARLAARYGITVNVAPTPGGGLTALVWLPGDLVSERSIAAPVAAPSAPGRRRGALDVGLRLAGRAGTRASRRPSAVRPAEPWPPPPPPPPLSPPISSRRPRRHPCPCGATPTVAAADPTASGLVRRVPGEHLAPALRSVTSSPAAPGARPRVPGPPVAPASPGSPEPLG